MTGYTSSLDGGLTPCAGCSLTNPFPYGLEQPKGSADGLLTGAGGTVFFVDQFGQSPYVDHYRSPRSESCPAASLPRLATWAREDSGWR